MDLFKRHIDTCIIIGFVIVATLCINNSIKHLQNDVTIIKKVLILKGIMPVGLGVK